ncbi:MAG: DNA-directed RNA polymerase subunit D [Candidatus Iainarchaeum archaeon]|uniref:DNA-directed RNA polymerase subunit Rpo3 n=1 Tax=Candidatus Iainarchaeum sp. TaxID=3101447 RepID=A0A497JJP1_9ARCH|nr:MAG: DNA-directed RNA polymerase subunit D [Candidatus Diapherotrites archaeon]
MNIKKVFEEGNEVKLLITGTNIALINAIRRTAMSEVPVLAIEDLAIHRNDSVLFDEYIGARLGLLPLKTDLKTYKLGDKVKLILKEKGPKMVLSSDIKCSDPSVEVVNKEVPIVKLRDNEEIFIEMQAEANIGKEHVKWQPALVAYNEMPKLEGKVSEREAKEVIKSCPKKILEFKAGKIIIEKPYECDLCGYCEIASKGKLKLVPSNNSFIFTIETYGGLTNQEILEKSVEVLEAKCKEFESEIKGKIK